MKIANINDILPLVEQPSRYLGSEINSIKKDYNNVKLSIALAFPDLYEVGTSHFGLQILYHILNKHENIAAERVFVPAPDYEAYLRASNIPLLSLENQRPLNTFDIIGLSLLYELNYTNVLMMLDLAKIPFYSKERDQTYPFIIAGGPCTCNPEPVADFFDAIVVGDGENVIVEMAMAWIRWKENASNDKEFLLKAWSEIKGVYIPSFFEAKYDERGFQTILPVSAGYSKVVRSIIPDLDYAPFPDMPVVPFGRPVHDRLRIEISRGCTRGCRFCQAGMIYRPVRERSLENIIDISNKSIGSTGYEDVSLLSLSTGDYCSLSPLLERLMALYESKHIAVSFPSLRAGSLTPDLINLVKKVRKTGFTIAPEAGSQRLRDVINKNITEEDIISSVHTALGMDWQVIKLYFMIGLPTETDDDIKALIDLVYKLRKARSRKNSSINVSVTTFIPKAHTPFQWSSQISLAESTEKIEKIKKALHVSGIHFKWQNPKVSLLEGLWARGDRRLSSLLVNAYQRGCRFDGWSERFRYDLWEEAIKDTGIDTGFYLLRERSLVEPLPWDHIDTGISKEFLISELEKAKRAETSDDCRDKCSGCGVCDFSQIEPKLSHYNDEAKVNKTAETEKKKGACKKLKILFSKRGLARFFGHLELINIFLRSIRRAGIEVVYSEGFHPMPKISFEDTLPIGMESICETFYLTVTDNTQPEAIAEILNEQLPEGLAVIDCKDYVPVARAGSPNMYSYEVSLMSGSFCAESLKLYETSANFEIERINRKGKQKLLNLKDLVKTIKIVSHDRLEMSLSSEPGNMVRPVEVLKKIFPLTDEEIKMTRIVKLHALKDWASR
ncbi:MAG: TIGR03960 family B12-binding radical SAM protein [Pseudomonadota bacterium]